MAVDASCERRKRLVKTRLETQNILFTLQQVVETQIKIVKTHKLQLHATTTSDASISFTASYEANITAP